MGNEEFTLTDYRQKQYHEKINGNLIRKIGIKLETKYWTKTLRDRNGKEIQNEKQKK